MRLAERLSGIYTGIFGGGIVKRTVIYVAAFGLGSLLVVWLLELGFVSLAEGLLPRPGSTAAATGSALVTGSAGARSTKPGENLQSRRKGLASRVAPTDNPGSGAPPGAPGAASPADNLAQNPAGHEPPSTPPRPNQAPPKAGEQSL